jgi:DNA-binding MarR family transcriptional regulator
MADYRPTGKPPANANASGDDLISLLNREAKEAIQRIAEHLHLSERPRTGLEADWKYRLVSQAYVARRERAGIFDANLFADPAWDILLAMFREHLAGRRMSADAAIEASDVPPSTGARWLGTLERRGLVTKIEDRVELTPAALEKLETYLERLRTQALMRVV